MVSRAGLATRLPGVAGCQPGCRSGGVPTPPRVPTRPTVDNVDMRCSRRDLLASAAALLPAGLLAQDSDTPIFTTGVKVVNVFATVRRKNGQIVRDLSKDDFSIAEDGRTQKIQYFSRET